MKIFFSPWWAPVILLYCTDTIPSIPCMLASVLFHIPYHLLIAPLTFSCQQ